MQKPIIVIWLVDFAVQKFVIVVWLVIFVVKKLVIVRDWIIVADDDSIAFDFRTLSSIFYVMFTCFFSLML